MKLIFKSLVNSSYKKQILLVTLTMLISHSYAVTPTASNKVSCPPIKDKTQLVNHSNFKIQAYLKGNPSVKRETICTTINRLSKKTCNKTLLDLRMAAPKGQKNFYGSEYVAWKECYVACNVEMGLCLRAPLKDLAKY